MNKPTRTLLITNIINNDFEKILEDILREYDIREIYTIKDPSTVRFVLFYNLKSSIEAQKKINNLKLENNRIRAYFAISKYEIPREIDKCDENKNQGSVLLMMRDMDKPLSENEIKKHIKGRYDIIEFKPFQKYLEFNDSREALNCIKKYNGLNINKGKVLLKIYWDYPANVRTEILNYIEKVLHNLKIGSDGSETKSNLFLEVFDNFIIENIDKIMDMVNNEK